MERQALTTAAASPLAEAGPAEETGIWSGLKTEGKRQARAAGRRLEHLPRQRAGDLRRRVR